VADYKTDRKDEYRGYVGTPSGKFKGYDAKTKNNILSKMTVKKLLISILFWISVMSSANDDKKFRVEGIVLECILIAFDDFKKSNDIKNYDLKVDTSNDELKITFIPHLDPKNLQLGGRTTNGRSVVYYLSTSEKRITRTHYQR